MVVGVNPVIQEVEAIAAPTVTTITLRSAWTGTGGTYSFLANQTSEGLRDAVQAIRTNNASLQSFIDSIDTAATANSVAQRTSDGSLNVTDLNADNLISDGATIGGGVVKFKHDQAGISQITLDNQAYNTTAAGYAIAATDSTFSAAMGRITFGRIGLYNESSASRDSYLGFSTVTDGAESERLRIDSSGNVGIGTTPQQKLHINDGGTGQVIFAITNADTGSGADDGLHIGLDGNENALFFNKENTASIFGTNNTERMRIGSSGNVGIGTSSPSELLEIVGSGGAKAVKIATESSHACFFEANSNSDGVRVRVQSNLDSAFFGTLTNHPIFFQSNGEERMRIDTSGNVLVATTSWSVGGGGTSILGTDGRIDRSVTTTDAAVQIYFANPNGIVGQISTSGSSTTYSTSSDYRLKEDWQPMEGNIDRLMQLKPCNFAWKVDGSRVDGFLAHEAQEVVPEAVYGTKDAMRTEQYEVKPAVYEDVVIPAEFDEEGNEISPERTEKRLVSEAVMGEREVPEYQGIDQSKLTPLLTAALQDAIKEIEALKARIEALEG
jgi:hypothetical protein